MREKQKLKDIKAAELAAKKWETRFITFELSIKEYYSIFIYQIHCFIIKI